MKPMQTCQPGTVQNLGQFVLAKMATGSEMINGVANRHGKINMSCLGTHENGPKIRKLLSCPTSPVSHLSPPSPM